MKGEIIMPDIYNELALLYLKNQDIKSLSPAELYNRYHEVLEEITNEAKKHTASQKARK